MANNTRRRALELLSPLRQCSLGSFSVVDEAGSFGGISATPEIEPEGHKMTTFIPPATAGEMANPAPEGSRHHQAVKIAASLIGNNLTGSETFNKLRTMYPMDVSDGELQGIVDWAEKQNFQPSLSTSITAVQSYGFQHGSNGGQPAPSDPASNVQAFVAKHPELIGESPVKPSPDKSWQEDALLAIEHLFKPGELINPVTVYREEKSKDSKLKYIPANNGNHKERDKALELIRKEGIPAGNAGVWLRMNPLDGKQTANNNVTVFRWTLLEFDTIPTELQLQFLRRLPLPIGTILTSGGKSVHCWVAVNAINANEYRKQVVELFKLLEPFGLDQNNKNPSRLSRMPGALRILGANGDGKQRLLYLNPAVMDAKLDLAALRFMLAADDGGITIAKAAEIVPGSPADIQNRHQIVLPTIRSLGDFSVVAENGGGNLMGNRFVCNGGGLLIAAPTGVGKSSFVMQASISWALGKDHLGIKPAFPLKTLIIQAENDDGDVAELRDGIYRGLGLTEEQQQNVNNKVSVVCESSATGPNFVKMVAALIELRRPNILVIDPLFAYLGGDVCDQAAVSAFLRNGLNPILQKYGCGLVLVHHTNKPQKGAEKADWKAGDFAYMGSGTGELANWARAVIGIRSIGEHDVFEMVFGKRGKRAGLVDAWSNPVYSQYIRHSKTGICWELGEAPAGKRVFAKADVLNLIPVTGTISQTKLFNNANELGIGEKRVRDWLKVMLEDEEVFIVLTRRPGTNPAKSYSRQKTSGDFVAETLAAENTPPKSLLG